MDDNYYISDNDKFNEMVMEFVIAGQDGEEMYLAARNLYMAISDWHRLEDALCRFASKEVLLRCVEKCPIFNSDRLRKAVLVNPTLRIQIAPK